MTSLAGSEQGDRVGSGRTPADLIAELDAHRRARNSCRRLGLPRETLECELDLARVELQLLEMNQGLIA